MKTIVKKIITLFLTFVIIFTSVNLCFIQSVSASSLPTTQFPWWSILKEQIEWMANNANPDEQKIIQSIGHCYQNNGFIVTAENFGLGHALIGGLWADMANIVDENAQNKTNAENLQTIRDLLVNGISFDENNHTYTISSDLNVALKEGMNYIINNSDPYVSYTFNINDYGTNFSNGAYFNVLKEFCQTYQDDYLIVKFNYNNSICLLPHGKYAGLLQSRSASACLSTVYSLDNWSYIPEEDDYRCFTLTNGEYVETDLYKNGLASIYSEIQIAGNNISTASSFISYNKKYPVLIFSDINNLKNWGLGKEPYYFNKTINNNWDNSSGDYTVSNDNSNKVTIGEINTHIGNIYDDTGKYPSLPDIEKWIQEQPIVNPTPTPTPTPDNPSGGNGGSGGSATATANNSGVNVTVNNNHKIEIGWPFSGTVSGNGTGGTVSGNGTGEGTSGGISNIFGFLGYIGELIGDLISGIGSALVGILEGVASAVQVVTEGIPNVLGPLIGFIFNGLPEEITALLTLCITSVLLIAIVKAIRK